MFAWKKKGTDLEIRSILIQLAVAAALVFGIQAVYRYFTSIDYRELNEREWKTVQVGIPYIRFECPVELKDKSRPPLGIERDLISRSQYFAYENDFDLRVIASIVDYHPHVYIEPANIAKSVMDFDKLFGATDITYEQKEFYMGSIKCIRLDGSFKKDDDKYIFSRVNAQNQNNFRDLLVIVRADDMEALLVKNRMVGTIALEPQ